MDTPDILQAADTKTTSDFRAFAAKVIRDNPSVRGYFPKLVAPNVALERLMTGPAPHEARALRTYPAAQRVALERARIAAEWKTAAHRVAVSIKEPDESDDTVTLTWVLTTLLGGTLAVFLVTAVPELINGRLLGIAQSILIPTAAAAGGLLLQVLLLRVLHLRTGIRVGITAVIAVSLVIAGATARFFTDDSKILQSSLLCATGAFLLAMVHFHTTPLVRIALRLLAHPVRAWELILQEPRMRDLHKLAHMLSPETEPKKEYFPNPDTTPLLRWLIEAEEKVIVDRLTQVINDHLGAEREQLLVEQHSEGLRRLHDPGLIVPTRSRRHVERALGRMDGGSIAIAGPRGSGKSTLLRQLCEPTSPPGLRVLVSAPAEYDRKEFLIELFLQVCEGYLEHRGLAPRPRVRGRWVRGRRRLTYVLRRATTVSLRAAISLAVLGFVIWSMRHALTPPTDRVRDVAERLGEQGSSIGKWFWTEWRTFSQIVLALTAFFFFPKAALWRFLRRLWQPEAVHEARGYWRRLRQEKTTTMGISGALSTLTFTGNSAMKDLPWTMPQLVGDLRRFLDKVATGEAAKGRNVLICIDEVDRIGSVDQAARFLSEIKAIFGIANCFFVVSVADEVGSIFARRAIAGRSVFENAFDHLVTIEPLNLAEAKELLQLRVGGFTETFVFLAYALSGGLPRELIRVTRRMVELNAEQPVHPRVGVLAELLVREELRELIGGTRSRLSEFGLGDAYAPVFTAMQEIMADLQGPTAVAPLARKLKALPLPPLAADADERAYLTVGDMAAFADFGLAIIQAFASFDLNEAKTATDQDTPGSYAALAVARQELSLSPASARRSLATFRTYNNYPE
ncbi:ATP-binding protein [Actinomadura graeca]|uniref:ATP-binding protein n=1 Tax=Actinomadura graeca TaxID=2750812 RepID=A0ABX8QPU4_9ACTN|nr:hypothetical protein [Actinomadura graeca]QXJ20179.1 ATP-binding protein [Actinomadura graeca]